MKKLILFTAILFSLTVVKAQVTDLDIASMGVRTTPSIPVIDSTGYKAVKDTTYKEDQRLSYLVNSFYPSLVEFIQNYNSQQKMNGITEIPNKAETKTLLNKIEKAINEYSLNFRQIKTIKVNKLAIEKEFTNLNAKISTLEADPDIKLSQFKNEFANIRKRQAKLSSYYNQLQKK